MKDSGAVANSIEAGRWIDKLSLQIQLVRDDIAGLCPWTGLLPVPARYSRLAIADAIPTLTGLQDMAGLLAPVVDEYGEEVNSLEEKDWLARMRAALLQGSKLAGERINAWQSLADRCEELSNAEYDFLLDKSTGLLSIGYNMEEHLKDA